MCATPELADLLAEIDAFLAETGMAPTTLGNKAVRNWRIVEHLRAGGDTGHVTAQKMRAWMSEYRRGNRGASGSSCAA